MIDNLFGIDWLDFLQSIGIMGSLYFAYNSARSNTRSRKVAHLLQINQSYRDIWEKTYSSPELLRIKEVDVDLQESPITVAESRFVKETILHMYAVYTAISSGLMDRGNMEQDFTDYLRLPIPHRIWQEVKKYYDSQFVKHLDGLLSKKNQL